MQENTTEQLVRDGVDALRRGDRVTARRCLLQAVEQDRRHEAAWLWLTAALDSDEEQIICLENVLKINPGNQAAHRRLEKLGTAPPLRSDRQQVAQTDAAGGTSHGTPDAFGEGLGALLTGAPPPRVKREPLPDESWRDALYDEHIVSEAVLVGSKDVATPALTLGDLFKVWLDMLLLNSHGGLDDEVQHGGFGHIALSVTAAGVLNLLAILLAIGMLFMLPSLGFRPQLISSTTAWLAQAPDANPRDASGAFGVTSEALSVLGLPEPADIAAQQAAQVRTNAGQQFAGLLANPVLLLTAYAVILIPTLLVGLLYYSIFINGVSRFYNGRGSLTRTFHALSLTLVAVQFTAVLGTIAVPLLPLGAALIVLTLLTVYQLTITSTALGHVQRLDRLAAAGMFIMGMIFGSGALALLLGGGAWLAGRVGGLVGL